MYILVQNTLFLTLPTPESEVVTISNTNTEIILIDDNASVSNVSNHPIVEADTIILAILSIDTNLNTNTNNASLANESVSTSNASTFMKINNVSFANESVSTSDASTSSSNLPKNKTCACYCVGKDKVNISFWLCLENHSNMIPQISKEIYSNLAIKTKNVVLHIVLLEPLKSTIHKTTINSQIVLLHRHIPVITLKISWHVRLESLLFCWFQFVT